jgi:hypothetical protein
MASAAVTWTAWKRLWGSTSRTSSTAAGRAQLGLQLGDAALGRRQLALFGAAQARLKAPVDAVLAPPGVDRLAPDPQRLGGLGARPGGLDQVQHLAARLRRIAALSPPRSFRVGWHGTQQHNSTKPRADQPPGIPGRFLNLLVDAGVTAEGLDVALEWLNKVCSSASVGARPAPSYTTRTWSREAAD